MITGINESKTLTKNISCECRFDGRKCNSDRWWNNDKCLYECEKYYIWSPSTYSSENGKCLGSILGNSVIMCDEITDADAEAKLSEISSRTTNLSRTMEKQKLFQQILMKKL